MLIALKKDDEIVVASTIAGSFVDTSKKDLALADNIPFWKVKGVKDCYVFAEDLTFTTDLLRYNDYVFKDITDGKSLITKVMPKMKELLNKYSCILGKDEWDSQLLIIKDNKMYTIGRFFSVMEEELVVFGNEQYVLGGLEANKDKSLQENILFTIRNLDMLKCEDSFPVVLFDNKMKRRKIIYK